ncbi:unnamed protein product [Lasius platythorax]|uniref:Uncharacterized protein n=1 Tax=Lasius platythorax TaxID=488582 RepID=A0AAV2NSU7_9HYME
MKRMKKVTPALASISRGGLCIDRNYCVSIIAIAPTTTTSSFDPNTTATTEPIDQIHARDRFFPVSRLNQITMGGAGRKGRFIVDRGFYRIF